MRNVLIIQTAAPKNWQSVDYWLERTCYRLFGRKDRMALQTEKPLEVKISDLRDKLKERIENISRRLDEIGKKYQAKFYYNQKA